MKPLDRDKLSTLPCRARVPHAPRAHRASSAAEPAPRPSRAAPAANGAISPPPIAGARHERGRAALRAGPGCGGARPLDRGGARRRASSRSTPRPTSLDSIAGRARRRLARARAGPCLLYPARAIARPRASVSARRRRRANPARRTRWRDLKPLLEDESVLKIGQNIKYDIAVLAGARHRRRADRLHHADLLRARRRRCTATGSTSSPKLHFDHDTIAYKDVAGSGKDQIGFAAVPLGPRARLCRRGRRLHAAPAPAPEAAAHRAPHARVLRDGRAAAGPRWWRRWSAPASPSTAPSSRASPRISRAASPSSSARSTSSPAIRSTSARPSSWARCCSTSCSLPGGKKGKTGAYGTDADVLEQLAPTHDLPARVLDWRQLSKLKSTYADALVEEINPRTGRVHTSYCARRDLDRAALLERSQSAEHPDPHRGGPQDPPRLRRRAGPSAASRPITARSSCALRRMSPMSSRCKRGVPRRRRHSRADRERGVRRARRKGIDPDIAPPRQGDQFRHHLRHQRLRPRAASSACRRARRRTTSRPISQRFPGIRDYMERTKAAGARARAMSRRCSAGAATSPASRTRNPARRAGAERQAINAPLQGAAADIIKRAMRRVPAALAKAGLKARMLLQVHDELVFEAPEGEAKATAALVKEVMEGACAPARRAVGAAGGRDRHGAQLGRGALAGAGATAGRTLPPARSIRARGGSPATRAGGRRAGRNHATAAAAGRAAWSGSRGGRRDSPPARSR